MWVCDYVRECVCVCDLNVERMISSCCAHWPHRAQSSKHMQIVELVALRAHSGEQKRRTGEWERWEYYRRREKKTQYKNNKYLLAIWRAPLLCVQCGVSAWKSHIQIEEAFLCGRRCFFFIFISYLCVLFAICSFCSIRLNSNIYDYYWKKCVYC